MSRRARAVFLCVFTLALAGAGSTVAASEAKPTAAEKRWFAGAGRWLAQIDDAYGKLVDILADEAKVNAVFAGDWSEFGPATQTLLDCDPLLKQHAGYVPGRAKRIANWFRKGCHELHEGAAHLRGSVEQLDVEQADIAFGELDLGRRLILRGVALATNPTLEALLCSGAPESLCVE